MIDKNGRLFGKINIIDLLIILILILAVVFVVVRMTTGETLTIGGNTDGEVRTVRVTFYGNYVLQYLPDAIAEGDPCSEYGNKIDMGTLQSFSYDQAFAWHYNDQTGELVKVPDTDHVRLTFTVETEGVLDEKGFTKEDLTFVVGGNYYINIGPTRTGCQIKSFEVVE